MYVIVNCEPQLTVCIDHRSHTSRCLKGPKTTKLKQATPTAHDQEIKGIFFKTASIIMVAP